VDDEAGQPRFEGIDGGVNVTMILEHIQHVWFVFSLCLVCAETKQHICLDMFSV
jgi:hypothetical protein